MLATPEWFQFLGAPRDEHDEVWAFSDQKSIHATPLVARKPITIVPGFGEGDRGIQSFDAPYLEFLRKLVDSLNAEMPVDIDDNQFVGPTGIHTEFDRLKTVAGYSMSPMSLAPRSNDAFVRELGLPSDFRTARHRQIFDTFARKVFGCWKVTSVKTAKASTAGTPLWVSSAKYKRDHALFLLANDSKVMQLFRSGRMVELAGYAKVVFMMNAGRRDQVDSVGRERLVFPYEYANSGGTRGTPIKADKHVKIDGRDWDDFSSTRARLFAGGPYAANLFPQIIATGTLHGGLFTQFAPTFHCTDVVSMAEEIGPDEDLRCSDATEYDRSMATFLLVRFFEIAREFWDEDVIDWVETLCFAAYYSRPVGLDLRDPTNRGVLMGDIFTRTRQITRGNPSGHAWTSLIAKFMMVFDWLATVDDLTHDVNEDMDDYLNHRKTLKTRNNGDDGLYFGERRALLAYTNYRFGQDNPGYFVLKPELGHVWSGYMMHRRASGWFTAFPRLHTAFEKILCPERSAGSSFRPKFSIGIIQRLTSVAHPLHSKAMEIFFRSWRDTAASTYGDFLGMVMAHHERLEPELQALTMIDRMVLDKPELLYYRFTEDDVSPVVISMLFEKALTPAEVLPFVMGRYKGTIIGEVNDH